MEHFTDIERPPCAPLCLMNLELFTDLREPSFSSSDLKVGVRNDTDGGKLGGDKLTC